MRHLYRYVDPAAVKVALVILTLVLLALSIGAPNSIGWPGSAH